MKKFLISVVVLSAFIVACNDKKDETKSSSASTIKLPYEAGYTTDFTNNVPDSSLLNVLNSYKYWETGDMKGLRSTFDDSAYVYGADGFKFAGHTDSLMGLWTKSRDSMSSVKITMDVWLKNHSVKDSVDYINVWYKEVDTYKIGRVDSFNFEDDNGLKKGKILWYSTHKQMIKK